MTAVPDTFVTGPPSPGQSPQRAPLSDVEPEPSSAASQFLVGLFVVVPLLALAAAIPLAWGWGLGWHDVVIALGIAGSLAIEGPLLVWVADRRRHHKYSDREGDPHSPWRFGSDWKALTKGFLYAHVGWLFDPNRTSQQKFCPDLLADRTIRRVSKAFPVWAAVSLLGPALIGGLWTMSLWGAFTAFFWATLVRVCLLHHVTWSINSVCHTFGSEDFEVRDKSRNVAWLAIMSFGESWHNLHHADPTCARHGALKGQIDISARVIRWAEQLGWAWDVRWPDEHRLSVKLTGLRKVSLGAMTKARLSRAR